MSWRRSSAVFFAVKGVRWENVTGRVGGQNVVDAQRYLLGSSGARSDRSSAPREPWMDLSEESKTQDEIYSNVTYETINVCVQNNKAHFTRMQTKRYALNTSEWLAKVRDEDMGEQEKRNSNLKELGAGGLVPQRLPVEILIGAPLHSTQGCVGKCVTVGSPREKKISPGSWCLLIAKVKFLPPWLIFKPMLWLMKAVWEMFTFCFLRSAGWSF